MEVENANLCVADYMGSTQIVRW